jgi:transcriptional regulator with XRE-family HTH domain
MTLGQKLSHLRTLEGFARGLERELTQSEVSRAIRHEMGKQISQSYLSQIESGTRRHLTSDSRLLLARFFGVHPGHLVDDPEDMPMPAAMRPRRDFDDALDLWLIEGSETFAKDQHLSRALVDIARHPQSRECLIVLGSIVENPLLMERLVEKFAAHSRPQSRKSRRGRAENS